MQMNMFVSGNAHFNHQNINFDTRRIAYVNELFAYEHTLQSHVYVRSFTDIGVQLFYSGSPDIHSIADIRNAILQHALPIPAHAMESICK